MFYICLNGVFKLYIDNIIFPSISIIYSWYDY